MKVILANSFSPAKKSKWINECQNSFEKIEILTLERKLMHYKQKLKIVVAVVVVSEYEIGKLLQI